MFVSPKYCPYSANSLNGIIHYLISVSPNNELITKKLISIKTSSSFNDVTNPLYINSFALEKYWRSGFEYSERWYEIDFRKNTVGLSGIMINNYPGDVISLYYIQGSNDDKKWTNIYTTHPYNILCLWRI